MIEISSKSKDRTVAALMKMKRSQLFAELERYGQMGVDALAAATPIETGVSAHGWAYRVIRSGKYPGIEWYNTHEDDNGVPVVILIQYGHGTGTGGYVHGRDFINPAMRALFDRIANEVWKKVTS